MYYVYALRSEVEARLYIGSSATPEARLRAHNAGRGGWTKNGRLSANGDGGWNIGWDGGAASGGSIWITGGCTVRGTGEIQFAGGLGGQYGRGAGGGGRLSLDGVASYDYHGSIRGTITDLSAGDQDFLSWGASGSVYFPPTIAANFTVYANKTVTLGADIENVFGNLTVHGILMPSGSPVGQGVAVVIRAANITVASDGSIDSSLSGFQYGPGYTSTYAGGSHGGLGQPANWPSVGTPASVYGSATEPASFGSAGTAGDYVNLGGGAMKLVVSGQLDVQGTILANGYSLVFCPTRTGLRVGGSGGSIWIDAGSLVGNGGIHADGGPGAWYDAADDQRDGHGQGRLQHRRGWSGRRLHLHRVRAAGDDGSPSISVEHAG
jgi:hypothetical protein